MPFMTPIKQFSTGGNVRRSIANLSTYVFHRNIFWTLLSTSAIAYFLFQKKLLPKPISFIVSKIFFYPSFPVTALLRYDNYWTHIDNTVILGCAPMAILDHPRKLHDLGVTGVINLCAEYQGPVKAYNELGITQLWLPTVDHFEPSLDSMKDAVKFINERKAKGGKVYVHCKAGHGRGASIALCSLMDSNPSIDTMELNAKLCKVRKVRPALYKQPNIKLMKEFLNNSQKK
jgi:atypical dual specificity phosphatase